MSNNKDNGNQYNNNQDNNNFNFGEQYKDIPNNDIPNNDMFNKDMFNKNQFTDESNRKADKICRYSVWLSLGSIISSIIIGTLLSIFPSGDESTIFRVITGLISMASSIAQLIAFILMIVVRIRYPANKFGKILMWIYISLAILNIIGIIVASIVFIFSFVSCMQSCGTELKYF